jgi:two-component system sensor histidine kinase YesM
VSALCALGGAAVSIFLSLQLSRQMFRPIGRLHDAISQVGQNDLQVQVAIEEDRRDELSELAQQFNRMVLSLRRNQQALLENQQALNDAQIRMLQAQLNPHFLCNTLDTMKWISKINQVPQVALMSTNLADILRFCILPDEFVPLEKELQILGRYVEIQRIRFSGTFQLRTQVDDGLLDVLVPKLMLQPLVENAIIHGFEDSDGGEIVVSAREELGRLLITVSDDGRGMSEESLRNFQAQILPGPGRHLGLHNVDAILRLHYGPDNGLRFVPTGGRGTCVRITLPITRREVPSC